MDRNLMVESTIPDGKLEPLGISAINPKNMLLNITRSGKYHQD